MRNIAPFILLLLLIAILFRVDFFFTTIYFLVATVVLSRLWAGRAADRVRAERRFASRAFAGDALPVELTVRNEGWLPVPWLEVGETVPLPLQGAPVRREVISLGPRESHTLRYTLRCRRRGLYTLGPLRLRTGDLLGLTRRDLVWGAAEPLIVYPRVVPLRRAPLPTRSPLATVPAPASLFEDASRPIGARDYQRGDSPRRIHWPATARAGRLIVKQYQTAIARDTLLCLDLDQESYEGGRREEASELAIVAAASLANHIAVRDGLPVGLLTAAHDPLIGERREFLLPPRAERAHLIALLETLARVEVAPGGAGGFASVVGRARAGLSWGTTVALITGWPSPAFGEAALALRRRGCAVVLLLVQPGAPSAPPDLDATLAGVAVWRIRDERDLERGR